MKRGFTLIELSVVLVIIALIAGGILVGRDLIAAAKLRNQVSQFQEFHMAVNTFRGKYGFLPADALKTTLTSLGFARSPSQHGGNNNGMINDHGGNIPIQTAHWEPSFFFPDL